MFVAAARVLSMFAPAMSDTTGALYPQLEQVRDISRSVALAVEGLRDGRRLLLLGEAARRYRHPVGGRWRVDETYCRLGGRWAYCYRAIDQDGQVVDVYVSERRNAVAARAFFERAIAETGVRPERVVTDKAACYPPMLRALLPEAEHRTSKYLNNGLERDHGHLKQRLRPMRGFKHLASADALTRGHALVQNLRNGFWTLTEGVRRPLRLATAWPQLARAI